VIWLVAGVEALVSGRLAEEKTNVPPCWQTSCITSKAQIGEYNTSMYTTHVSYAGYPHMHVVVVFRQAGRISSTSAKTGQDQEIHDVVSISQPSLCNSTGTPDLVVAGLCPIASYPKVGGVWGAAKSLLRPYKELPAHVWQ